MEEKYGKTRDRYVEVVIIPFAKKFSVVKKAPGQACPRRRFPFIQVKVDQGIDELVVSVPFPAERSQALPGLRFDLYRRDSHTSIICLTH